MMNQPDNKESSSLIKLFKSCDFFGVKPRLYIYENEKYKTLIGGLISVIIFFLIMAAFIFFGMELVKRENPQIVKSELFQTNPDEYKFRRDNFFFFIGVQDKSFEYYIEPSILDLRVNYWQVTRKIENNGYVSYNYTANPLHTEPCDIEKHAHYFKDSFSNLPLSSLYCIKPEYYDQLSLIGSFGEEKFFYISIELKMCQNSTKSGIVCQDKNKIDSLLKGGFFVINYIDTIFEPRDFNSPQKYIRKNFYTTMSNEYFKELNFYFKNIDYKTDQGTVMEDNKIDHFLQFDRQNENYDFRSIQGNESFVSCVLRLSNSKDLYIRRYTKLQDVIAQVGGLVKGLFIIVKIIYMNFSVVDYVFNLGENLFYTEESSSLDYNSNNNFIYNKNLVGNVNVINNSAQRLDIEPVQPKIKRELVKYEKNHTEVKCSDKLKTTLCFYNIGRKSTGKQGLFFKISKNIKEQSDIRVLFRMYYEIENLKNVLFSKDQKILFEFTSWKHKLEYKTRNNDISKIMNSYEKLQNDEKYSDAIKKLFEKKMKV